MGENGGSRWLPITAVTVLAIFGLCGMGLVVMSAAGAGGATGAEQATQGSTLRRDAPIPPQYLKYVLQS